MKTGFIAKWLTRSKNKNSTRKTPRRRKRKRCIAGKITLIMAMMTMITMMTMSMQPASAQSVDVQQLLLNVTKLSQFKQLLKDLQAGYSILNSGYNKVKQIASGNFSLHEAFIDGLLLVNPSLAKYRRVADIISDEKAILSRYKASYKFFKASGRLDGDGLDYLMKVYGNLVDRSIDNLDALAMVLTAGELSLSDAERLTEINRLYKDTHQMLQFLSRFNNRVAGLVEQTARQAVSIATLKALHGAANGMVP